jgi:sigma-E factor negative regulatory protein RseA
MNAEKISCLVDGQLERDDAEALLAAVCSDPKLRSQWQQLHLVGDALRSSEVAAHHTPDFCDKVAAALAAEPTVLAPRPVRARQPMRRFILPGIAVAASMAALSFVAVPMLTQPPAATVAKAPTAPPVALESAQSQPPLRRTGPLPGGAAADVYLSAHRELTGGTAMPRAVHYLRVGTGEDR